MSSIKKHSVLLGFSNVIFIILNFISGIFLTRILGVEGRGILTKIEAGSALLAQLTTLKSHMGIIYFVANEKIEQRKVIGIGLVIILGSLILSALILLFLYSIGKESLILPLGYTNIYIVIYTLLLFLFTQGQIITSSYLRGIRNFEEIYVNQIFVALFRLVFFCSVYFIGLRYVENIGFENGLVMHLIVLAVSLCSTLYFFLKNFGFKPSVNFSWSKDISPFLTYVSMSYFALFMNFLNRFVDIWIVEYFRGSKELGFYALAVNLSVLLLVFSSVIREVLIPYLAKGSKEENLKNLKFFSRVNFTGIMCLSFVLFFVADFFIPLLYGAEFQPSVLPFKYLIFAVGINGFGMIFSAYNYGTGVPKLNFYANLVGVIVILILDFLLIPEMGIEGAAIASLIAYSVSSLLIFLSVMHFQKVPFTNYFFLTKADVQESIALIKEIRKK